MSAEIIAAATARSSIMLLQWGRAPMSAEITYRVLTSSGRKPLQWGRAPMSAEITAVNPRMFLAIQASMGPRSDERGNRVDADDDGGGGQASMGPRSDERGNHRITHPLELAQLASMGPRSDERGNEQARGVLGPRMISFNGAALR